MSDLQRVLAELAERGTHEGSERLRERVVLDLAAIETTRSQRTGARSQFVFAGAAVLILVLLGTVPLLMRTYSDGEPSSEVAVTTIPAPMVVPPSEGPAAPGPTTSTARPVTTIPSTTTLPAPVPDATVLASGWKLRYETNFDVGAIIEMPGGGFLAAGLGPHLAYSNYGVDWSDADADGAVLRDAGWIAHAAVVGERAVVAGHTCEGQGDMSYEPRLCPQEMGIWVGSLGEDAVWERIPVEEANLYTCRGLAGECYSTVEAIAAASEELLVVGELTTGIDGSVRYVTDRAVWIGDLEAGIWHRHDLPSFADIGEEEWRLRNDDPTWAVDTHAGPATRAGGQWLVTLVVSGWDSATDYEESEQLLLASTDGSNWELTDGPGFEITDFATGPDGVVAVGVGSESGAAYTSDGVEWRAADFDDDVARSLASAVYDRDLAWVALGYTEMDPGGESDFWVSTDGVSWYRAGHSGVDDISQQWRSIASTDAGLAVIGNTEPQDSPRDQDVSPSELGVWIWER